MKPRFRHTRLRRGTRPPREHPLVGQYIDTYLPAVDGVIITVQNYARWLNAGHCSCYVAAAEANGYRDADPFPVIRYHSVPLRGRPPYRFGIPRLDMDFRLNQYRLAPDLVHAHSPFGAGREALRVARNRRIPLVASFHSKYYDDVLQATGSERLAAEAVKYVVSYYNKADYVWTVNQGTANTLRDYGFHKPVEIVPNGTDFVMPQDIAAARRSVEERFRLAPETPLLLFVGQHILQKNLPMLLEGVALYKRFAPGFKLLMVGEGPARPALEARAAELGLGADVIFAGVERERARLSAIYLRADLFVFPSVYDNAPLVVREAAMAGCPAVMIAGSNAAESARDGYNAYLCENDPRSLCQALLRAFADGGKRRRVGEAASRTIAKPWQEIVQEVYARYAQILGRK